MKLSFLSKTGTDGVWLSSSLGSPIFRGPAFFSASPSEAFRFTPAVPYQPLPREKMGISPLQANVSVFQQTSRIHSANITQRPLTSKCGESFPKSSVVKVLMDRERNNFTMG